MKNLEKEVSDSWIEDVLNNYEPTIPTTKEMEDYCKQVLNDVDGIVPECDVDFLYEIMEHHPHWKEKTGCGFHHFEVRTGLYGKKCFYIVRTDGTETDISYRKAILYPTKRAEVMKACRTIISPVIENVRNDTTLPFTCPITGDIVTDNSDIHIDHYDLTFKELFDKWVEDKDINELYDKLSVSKSDNCMEIHFDDPILTMDFYEFHNNNTHLRPVSKRANLSVLKKKH